MKRRALDSQELDDFVQIVTKGADASPDVLARAVEGRRTSLVRELRRYGEDAVASQVESLPAAAIDSIYARGMKIAFDGAMILTAFCLAAVEEVEGSFRPLARKRRKPAT